MLEAIINQIKGAFKPVEYSPGRRKFIRDLGLGIGAIAVASSIPTNVFAQEKEERNGLSPNANYSDIVDHLRDHRQTVDYEKIWNNDTPVLFVGERHTSLSDKTEIINQIPEFKKSGMTHLAMEMLHEEHQPIIDGYFNGTVSREKVEEIFRNGWDKKEGAVEKYIGLVDTAKDNGIKVLAIDLYTPTEEYFTARFFRKRNSNWARIIQNTISNNPNSRVLVYDGQSHSGYNMVDDSANEILTQRGIKSRAVEFAGAEKPEKSYEEIPESVRDITVGFYEKITYAAQKLGIADKKFGVPVVSKHPTYPADYVIHLPQTEK